MTITDRMRFALAEVGFPTRLVPSDWRTTGHIGFDMEQGGVTIPQYAAWKALVIASLGRDAPCWPCFIESKACDHMPLSAEDMQHPPPEGAWFWRMTDHFARDSYHHDAGCAMCLRSRMLEGATPSGSNSNDCEPF